MATDLTSHRNIFEAFAAQAAGHPGRIALTIARGRPPAHETVTFEDLARRVERRAAGLVARCPAGARVLIAMPTGVEFAELYLACLRAGLVAVPAPASALSMATAERIAVIAADCAPAIAFTTAGDEDMIREQLAARALPGVVVEVAGPLDDIPGEPFSDAAREPGHNTLGVLQYSSGSTGTPNGVMLTHGDILANLTAFGTASRIGSADVFGSWIPLHHDMGLFSQLTAGLLYGAPVVLMPPTDFVRRPVDWLRMMDETGTTVTAAPNFAFELCRRAVTDEQLQTLDLSALRIVFNGSEPIHAPTMNAFVERFAGRGLRPEAMTPAYGLAEATIFVSTSAPGVAPTVLYVDPAALETGQPPRLTPLPAGGKPVVGVGMPVGLRLSIVDPATTRPLPDGAIGEIWLRGPGIGAGYWNRPGLTRTVFGARAAGAEHAWLRTGDLGAVVDDELFITGRLKELLIVHGRNLFPQDLEQEAREAHEALRGCVGAAFSVAAPDERIVLVHEITPRLPVDSLAEVGAAVARRLTVVVGAAVRNVLLVRRGTVRRTTSGKIQRSATRARFLAGELVPLYAELEPSVRELIGGARG